MESLDNEKFILKNYRKVPSIKVFYCGRTLHCWRVKKLTKSILFSKSWVDSSGKDVPPPDFYNDKHHIMMEMMRVDDSVGEINGKHVPNSFEKASLLAKHYLGKEYKKIKHCTLYCSVDTSDPKRFNFEGYFKNFERTLKKHSDKVANYRENHPNCKTMVFFVHDESNVYVQVSNKDELKRRIPTEKFRMHKYFFDRKFLDVIKSLEADYVIWMGYHKDLYINNRRIFFPTVCIYDVKRIKEKGVEYNHELMFKVVDEVESKYFKKDVK